MDAKRRKYVDGGVRLPEDIVFELLARLPTKALCRFRCVCKGWRALISDPAFVAAQRPRAAADPHLVGVFLGSDYRPEVRLMDMDGNVVKAFEITRRRSTLLPPQLATRPDLICADGGGTQYNGIIIDPTAGEAFGAFDNNRADPSAMSYSTILGRAAPSGLFKVLRLEEPVLRDDHDDDGQQQLCEVATIMDGNGGGAEKPLTWRRKSAPPFVITGLIREYWAIVNGVVYFIHELEIDDDVGEDDNAVLKFRIVAFDLESEEWKMEVIKGPTLGHEEEGWSVALVELNGFLTFVHKILVNGHPYTRIWLLVDPDKSVWVKEYMIPMSKSQIEPSKPLGVLVDGRILLWSIVFENQKTSQNNSVLGRSREVVQFYNPSTKVFTDFVEMARWSQYALVFYNGSLLQ